MDATEAIALGLIAFFAISVLLLKRAKLAYPNDNKFVHLEEFGHNHRLGKGPVEAALIRQSGNIYRHLGFFEDPEDALIEIEKSFRRAKIDSVSVLKNTEDRLEISRLYYDGRGRSEGKKLGGAVIVRAQT